MRRVVDAEVHRVHVGPQLAAQQACQRCLVAQPLDAIQQGPHGGDAARLDRSFVEISRAEVGHLACVGSRRGGDGVVDQLHELTPGSFCDLATGAPLPIAGRNLRRFEPAAVGVAKEVVAGLRGRVDGFVARSHGTAFGGFERRDKRATAEQRKKQGHGAAGGHAPAGTGHRSRHERHVMKTAGRCRAVSRRIWITNRHPGFRNYPSLPVSDSMRQSITMSGNDCSH